jgi:hypothetical protein
MESNFNANACIPKRVYVFGLELMPLCLGHKVNMQSAGCAFGNDITDGITYADLLTAVLICHFSYEGWNEFKDRETPDKWSLENLLSIRFEPVTRTWGSKFKLGSAGYAVWRWSVKVSGKLSLGFNLRRKSKFILDKELFKFKTYLEESTTPTVRFSQEAGAKVSNCPWYISMLDCLMTQCKFTESQAYNLPMQLATLHRLKQGEKNGTINFYSDSEIDLLERITNGTGT